MRRILVAACVLGGFLPAVETIFAAGQTSTISSPSAASSTERFRKPIDKSNDQLHSGSSESLRRHAYAKSESLHMHRRNDHNVEEKFGKYIGYLARCEGKFSYYNPIFFLSHQNQPKCKKKVSKFENRALTTLFEI